jgi:putative ABC transport system permease protein
MSNSLRLPLLFRTAWRDSRRNRGKLALFMSSIVLGIAALVAINSFNYNVASDIDEQAASLLGADIVVSGNRPAAASIFASLDSLPAKRAAETELLSMAYFPRVDGSQFVRIKALAGDFPFYGELKTAPPSAKQTFRTGRHALVEETLLLQHDLSPGDSIRLGPINFEIVGHLQNAFGGSGFSGGFAPVVYIPQDELPATELVQPGSLVNYQYYASVPPDFDVEQWKVNHEEQFRLESMRIEIVSDRKADLSEAFDALNTFLNLVALVALLLGCIGVASSVFIYIREKIPSIAIFRCLGMSGAQAFGVYFAQILILGLLGALLGTLIGSAVQMLLPLVLSDLLPFEVDSAFSALAVVEGLSIGVAVTVLFALLPLMEVRRISPLRTLRVSLESDIARVDHSRWIIGALIALSLWLFLWHMTDSSFDALVFAGSLIVAFALLWLVAKGITLAVRRYFPRSFTFVIRQGVANLYRPNNQTLALLISIGLGTAVMTTLFVTQGLILKNVARMDAGNQPNMILFGIESDQRDSLNVMTKSFGLPLIEQVPIVTMRLEGWQGRSKSEWLADSNRTARGWAIHREARVTYRDSLDENERLVAGKFIGRREVGDTIFISLAEGYAEALDVDIGDQLVFNVQGTRMETYVSSLRKIDFANMNTRFFIVFPTGVLERAPQFHVLVTKSPGARLTADYRTEVVKTFPNISVVDLTMILQALGEILRKVSYVIKFMAAFCILTGLVVLISSLLLSKYQRIRESVLLRTLGASRSQIFYINATEYIAIGVLAAATGIALALAGSFLLARFQLELAFTISWLPIAAVFVIVVALTMLIGLINHREVVNKPPLEVLRKEVG